MKLTRICFSLLVCVAVTRAQADVLYDADFSGSEGVTHTTSSPAPAAPHSVAGPNWTFSYDTDPSTDSTENYARAAGDHFETADWGGEAQVISDAIDVSSESAVDIEWVGDTVGSAVFNATAEYFEWFYILDAGTPVTQSTKSDGSLDLLLSNVDVSSASSLEVGFKWLVDGAGDGFDMNSLTVSTVPEPATLALMALALGATCCSRRKRR